MTPKLTKRQREVLERMADGAYLWPTNIHGTLRAGTSRTESKPLSVRPSIWGPLHTSGLIKHCVAPSHYRITEAGLKAPESNQ